MEIENVFSNILFDRWKMKDFGKVTSFGNPFQNTNYGSEQLINIETKNTFLRYIFITILKPCHY